jgi:hypothetical protein
MLKIELTGPGTTFGYQLKLIEKVLKEAGFMVKVLDNNPDDRELEDFDKEIYRGKRVSIITNHQPWGG